MWMSGNGFAAPLEPKTVTLRQPGPDGSKVDRNYHILMPPNLRRGERPPAVILLHDAGDDALAAVYRHGWIATAAQARFAIIAPEAGYSSKGGQRAGFSMHVSGMLALKPLHPGRMSRFWRPLRRTPLSGKRWMQSALA